MGSSSPNFCRENKKYVSCHHLPLDPKNMKNKGFTPQIMGYNL